MRALMTVVLVGLTACSSTNGGGGTGGGGGADGGGGEAVDAGPVGTGESSTQRIGPSGGSVTVGCFTLTVPAGALSADVDVTLTSTTERPPAGYETYSPVVRIEPAMTALAAPASLSLCFNGNAQLATVFLSREGTTGYERRGGVVTGNSITAPISRFGDAFVANGVEYVDPANRNCADLTLLEGRSGGLGSVSLPDGGTANLSSSVALMFRAEDCYGRPLTGLTSDDFVVKEDDAPLSVEANKTILPTPGLQVFASLVLDMSSSTQPNVMQLITAAKAFVNRVQGGSLRVPISIQLFAGEPTLREWQAPTLDTAKLLQKLDDVATYTPMDPASTNLYGAVIDALSRSATAQNAFRQRNAGGAFSTGYVILFTDGQDTTGLKTRMEALTAAKASPDTLVAVALNTPDFTAAAQGALNELTSGDASDGKNVLVSDNAARLATDFDAVAYRIAGLSTGAYLLGYCSPKRAGQHSVAVELANATTRQRAEWSFSATGFSPGCSSEAFSAVCQDASGRKECGGLACGSCDDRVAKCNTSTLRCDSYCLGPPAVCGGTVITNPLDYEQTCNDSQESTECGTACRNLSIDTSNCGTCGNTCPVGARCALGVCSCPAGWSICNGFCVDLQGDRGNCGLCGNTCATGGYCSGGQCGCQPNFSDCNGTCTNITTTTNCGTCGNTCATGASCTQAACQCPQGQSACSGQCVSLTSIANCGQCGNQCSVLCVANTCIGATNLSVGTQHSCARLENGEIRCWGSNTYGQLGNNTTQQQTLPVSALGLPGGAALVAVGAAHSCALMRDSTIRCWGYNANGQLGDGTTTNRTTAVQVVGLSGAVRLFVGTSSTCARLQDNTVRCWGANIGDGTSSDRTTPVAIPELTGASQIVFGQHNCAVLSGGTVRCWGANSHGQLGDGTTTPRSSPVLASGLFGAIQVEIGTSQSCALLQDGRVTCWGLAFGSPNVMQLVPTIVPGISGAIQLSHTSTLACARILGGSVQCWGIDALNVISATPVVASGVATAVELKSNLNANNTCVRLQDDSVQCWGQNGTGNLGNGTTASTSTPTTVLGLSSVSELGLGNLGTNCAILQDKSIRCWGYNATGQLGDGTTTNRSVPTPVRF